MILLHPTFQGDIADSTCSLY